MTHDWASGQSNFRSNHSQNLEPWAVCAMFVCFLYQKFLNDDGLFICCEPGGSSEPLNKLAGETFPRQKLRA